ncbi:MAG: hypothetical protein M1818_007051 [Claussenomyces sp. TS43310]|nr:MAG: hypothetical protein M1818_007051 [Claussenomyces sp. TS43310]
MSRRLAQATEDALLEGGRAGRKAVEEAGFSEELKARLLERVEAAKFQSEHTASFAEAGLSSSAGRGTRDVAAAQPWVGVEATEDTVLRMLDDAHKPLNPGLRGPSRGGPGNTVDLRIKPKPKRTSGQTLANARDKASIYAISKDTQMSDKEREEMRKELKDRFTPAARAMPNSLRGLQALANERIEDAIARGQFKNIPRGKDVQRDTRSDNPFIDTTEYIMNKMIQRQDIVPPWIEKQQELVKTANNFRSRLRHDWKRHAARTMSSRGGSLQHQVAMANLYAEAEKVHNPKRRKVEDISVPTTVTGDPLKFKITQEAPAAASSTTDPSPPAVHVTLESSTAEFPLTRPESSVTEAAPSDTLPNPSPPSENASTPTPLPAPFRDPAWEAAERSYLTLAISNLNSLTRSYNLMAPDLAKKPYFNLERELRACFADVAPQLAGEIVERAARPRKDRVEGIAHRPGSLMERFGTAQVRVYDERRKQYGLRELWRDLWTKEG